MQSIDTLKDSKGRISKRNLLKILPYGEEFLFLDEVVALESAKVTAVKKVSGKESFMRAHFTNFPLMPGALAVEAIGQAAAVLARYGTPNYQDKHVVAYKVMDARFYAPILPLQEMVIQVVKRSGMHDKILVEGSITVNGKMMAETAMILAIVDKKWFEEK